MINIENDLLDIRGGGTPPPVCSPRRPRAPRGPGGTGAWRGRGAVCKPFLVMGGAVVARSAPVPPGGMKNPRDPGAALGEGGFATRKRILFIFHFHFYFRGLRRPFF